MIYYNIMLFCNFCLYILHMHNLYMCKQKSKKNIFTSILLKKFI